MKAYILIPQTLFYIVLAFFFTENCQSQIPESLEGKIDMLGGSVAENDVSRDYFINLGPDVVPIVTKKLMQSLAEGASPSAGQERIIMQMPRDDQKRVRHQIGLVAMQSHALGSMSLSPEARKEVEDSLYQALKSPYIAARRYTLTSIGINGDLSAVENVIPLLYDADYSNRIIAAQTLAKIGDASTAEKIEKILEKRRQGLTAEQIEKDWSFRHGYEAIESLRNGATAVPNQSQSTTDPLTLAPTGSMPAASPSLAATTKPTEAPAADYPIAVIVVLVVVIAGAIVFLFRRKAHKV